MSKPQYRSALRAAVRGFWSGIFDYAQFLDAFGVSIEQGITRAWFEGARQCGIEPDELNQDELRELESFIIRQRMQMGRFADAIEDGSKENGGKLGPLFGRVELWVNQYDGAKELAASLACGNQKAIWILGPTEEHCKSCGGFAGRVYRREIWAANGALPRSSRLCCNGFRCLCRLEPTDQRITPGRFPARLLCN